MTVQQRCRLLGCQVCMRVPMCSVLVTLACVIDVRQRPALRILEWNTFRASTRARVAAAARGEARGRRRASCGREFIRGLDKGRARRRWMAVERGIRVRAIAVRAGGLAITVDRLRRRRRLRTRLCLRDVWRYRGCGGCGGGPVVVSMRMTVLWMVA